MHFGYSSASCSYGLSSNLNPFNCREYICSDTYFDINGCPKVLPKDYQDIIIPNIIRCGGIPKDKLEIGKTYIGDCRNASEAVWNGKDFTYMRTKFGYTYPEDINHFEDDNGYDLFIPIKLKNEK
mgnify:CR=1 FL=1